MTEPALKTVHVLVSGRVQGIGFRYWTQLEAEARGLAGWVRNLIDGRVEAVFQGPAAAVDAMVAACHEGPRLARVDDVRTEARAPLPAAGFTVLPTGEG